MPLLLLLGTFQSGCVHPTFNCFEQLFFRTCKVASRRLDENLVQWVTWIIVVVLVEPQHDNNRGIWFPPTAVNELHLLRVFVPTHFCCRLCWLDAVLPQPPFQFPEFLSDVPTLFLRSLASQHCYSAHVNLLIVVLQLYTEPGNKNKTGPWLRGSGFSASELYAS